MVFAITQHHLTTATTITRLPRVLSQKFLQQLRQHYLAVLGLGALLSSPI